MRHRVFYNHALQLVKRFYDSTVTREADKGSEACIL